MEISNLDFFFNQKIKEYSDLKKVTNKNEIRERLKEIYGTIREKIISQIMIRRTRTDLMSIDQYKKNLEEQKIKFPETGKPNKIYYKLDQTLDELYESTMEIVQNLNYAIYEEVKNLKPEFKKDYDIPEVAYSALADIMKTLLVKRLDSSFEAFKGTLKNLLNQLSFKVKQFENEKIFIFAASAKIDIGKYILEDNEEELEKILLDNPEVGKIYKPDDFEKSFFIKISEDFHVVKELYEKWSNINQDPKYDIFLEKLKNEFFNKDINHQGKIVVFSEAKVTTDYLVKRLREDGFDKIFAVDGENRSKAKALLQSEFDENFDGEKTNKVNILISTEVLSEGLTYIDLM